MSASKDFHFSWERHLAVAVLIAAAIAFYPWRRRRRCRRDDGKRSSPPLRRQPSYSEESALAAKIDFLDREGGRYGYSASEKGFIDDWRSLEFPALIPPLKMPRRLHPRRQRSPESSAGQHRRDDAIAACDESSEPEVYLDYAGSAIPTRTLLSRISCESQILANPHSQGGGIASDRTLKLMQLTRDRVMKHFGIQHESFGLGGLDKEENTTEDKIHHDIPCPGYQLVFTSGATDSLRLVAERFPWTSLKFTADRKSRIELVDDDTGVRRSDDTDLSMHLPKRMKSIRAQSILLFPRNVHTSVIGMRQIALQRGARFQSVSVDELLGATSEWFRKLTEGSMLCEHREARTHDAENEEEEKKAEFNDVCLCAGYSKNKAEESASCETMVVHHLLVLPLECNFGGDRFDWRKTTAMAQESCVSSYLYFSSEDHDQSSTIRISHKWHILLDTAKAAATSPVKLPALTHGGGPDFAVISFYKIFGAPTGLGALFVKKHRRRRPSGKRVTDKRYTTKESRATEAPCNTTTCSVPKGNHFSCGGIAVERGIPPRQFFGGGSVDVVLATKDFVVPRNSATSFVNGSLGSGGEGETVDLGVMVHGTEHFRGIASLAYGFRELVDLGGMEAISSHSTCLAEELVRRLGKLVHDNGKPVVHLYGRWKSFAEDDRMTCPDNSGPTVAFNVFHRDGSPIGYDEVSRLAALNRPPIQLRTGCFCNPGACQDAIPLTDAEVLANYASGHVCGDRRGVVDGKLTGAIRASFGKDSLWEDMDALASFVDKVFVSRGKAFIASESPDESECNSRNSNVATKIDSLFVFPIKSCAAMRVNRWPIDRRTGRLAFDREFALVDASGFAMRLHSFPKMGAIQSDIDFAAKMLTVTAPGHKDLILNLEDSNLPVDQMMSPEDVQVCGTLCKGSVWGGSKAARWFSSVLGVRCWLARHYAGEAESVSDYKERYAYCNEASLLLVSQQSISFLNSVIRAQGWGRLVESRHFRPNIVVSSENLADASQKAPDPEDSWQNIVIRGSTDTVELMGVGKCARCQMVDVDPNSGTKGNTLRALAQYRRERGQINFGTFFAGNPDSSVGNAWLEEGSEVYASSIISNSNSE